MQVEIMRFLEGEAGEIERENGQVSQRLLFHEP
jgi:hypothetical protein